ncbi:MAG: hypothetical protein MJZ37_00215 [Bacilli bacterium]|nr:hypothetical protein [Bacilli bacterium]
MRKIEALCLYEEQKLNISNHEPLVALSCLTYEEDETEEEFTFTVPIEWLIRYMDSQSGKRYWDWEKVQHWLQHRYTYEDSKPIFDEAIMDNVCININF